MENPENQLLSPSPTPAYPSPPWKGVGRRIESATRKAMYDFKMVDNCQKIAVALSGGKDSLTLLFMLKAISGRGFPPFDLMALHVGGEFSCGASVDSRYLQKICDAMNIPLDLLSSTQKLETLECYSCSRERRSLLFDAAKNGGATTIAFGHHRDDSVETVLMNLLHKAEFAGNLPKIHMYDYGVTIIRPLIFIAEEDIITFAKQENFLRAMCKCPVGQRSMRQKVSELLLDIEKIFPNARENIAQGVLQYGSTKAKGP